MNEPNPKPVRSEDIMWRRVMRHIWADKGSRVFLIVAAVLTLAVPLLLIVTLPTESPDQGFWLDLGHDWVTRGPITLVVGVFFTVVTFPLMLWTTRRRLRRDENGR